MTRAERGLHWMRQRLFGSPASAALTIVIAYALFRILPQAWDWLVTSSVSGPATIQDCVRAGGACWSFLQDRWRFILFGTFPYDEQWRAATALMLFASLIVASCFRTLWHGTRRRIAMLIAWMVALLLVAMLMGGGVLGLARVPPGLWSGLPLTVMLATAGVFFAFWFAILLALGRQSRMTVLRWLSIGYIELVRGVPLISLLFMIHILFPLLVPPDVNVDKLLRAQLAFILFFAAYMAEAIRGGLQAVPLGQYAAAEAIGLGYWQTQRRIILPQALRLVIPSLVNIFIAAFKDTSLVIVISMLDLLGTANAAKADPRWWGIYIEPYLFVAFIYLAVCASMSHWSQHLERRLGMARRF
jgi:general L-amino acid transport system permease protein